ncbi:MAG: hypothetical protein AVDCRST_MAG96-2638 [uncultured Segetibacter sp.]|uniref:Uncharacterized protein n=1 Tax=uncultured Segetibacter sp. TaxID=481133 RepID=A0A6J4T652_9BACT|nr:MAG: hypothetical protein AVDCRST_MAG96-2638 [uncultured Segetibacter sp.]
MYEKKHFKRFFPASRLNFIGGRLVFTCNTNCLIYRFITLQ